MWSKVANKMGVPWRTAAAMHWQLGAEGMVHRAASVTLPEEGNQNRHTRACYQMIPTQSSLQDPIETVSRNPYAADSFAPQPPLPFPFPTIASQRSVSGTGVREDQYIPIPLYSSREERQRKVSQKRIENSREKE